MKQTVKDTNIKTMHLSILLYMEKQPDDIYYVADCIEFGILHSEREAGKDMLIDTIQNLCICQLKYAIKEDPDFEILFGNPSSLSMDKMANASREVIKYTDECNEDGYKVVFHILNYDTDIDCSP